MFISSWILWTFGLVLWLGLVLVLFDGDGPYDFFKPMVGLLVFFIGVAFAVGFLVGS